MLHQSTPTNDTINPYRFQHNYSITNVTQILHQCPQATAIASYRQWQALGRQVRKGEKALRILAPIGVSVREDGTEKLRFKDVPVFDISQTDLMLTETCPSCSALMAADDRFCGECGLPVAIQPATSAKDDYTIATDTNVVIAEVRHIDAPAPTVATDTTIYADTLVRAIKPLLAAMRKQGTKSARERCPDLYSFTITADANGCTIAPLAQDLPIEPVTVPLVSLAGSIDAVLSFDNADMLTHILDTKKDAVLSIEDAPEYIRSYTTALARDAEVTAPHLVIKQQSAAVGRTDTYRIKLAA